MNQWKSAHAIETKLRTLEEAMKGADIFVGLSAKGAVTPEMVKAMAKNPIIFSRWPILILKLHRKKCVVSGRMRSSPLRTFGLSEPDQ